MNLCVDAELPEKERTRFFEHMACCPNCAKEYGELTRLMHELGRHPAPTLAPGSWDEVWREVRHRLSSPAGRNNAVLQFRPIFATAVALMVIAIGIAYRLHTPQVAVEFPAAEMMSHHAMVMMHHPYTEPGMVLFSMSEGTLAGDKEKEHGTH